LDYKKLGLFKIDNKIELVNYKLKLLNIIRIYLIFYISLLELVLDGVLNALYIEVESLEPNTEYKVEEILDQKYIRERLYYLIK
jgi:hypothetical protein